MQCELEKKLDRAVQKGELDRAAALSDAMATRELACKVATAFDCVDYDKRRRVSLNEWQCGILGRGVNVSGWGDFCFWCSTTSQQSRPS